MRQKSTQPMEWAQEGATARVFVICRQFFRGFHYHILHYEVALHPQKNHK